MGKTNLTEASTVAIILRRCGRGTAILLGGADIGGVALGIMSIKIVFPIRFRVSDGLI